MGMFTSIKHPVDERELQIKCGYDFCDTYEVGDKVAWYVDPDCPGCGKLLDDVYDSFGPNGPDDWVVIKDHTIAGVFDKDKYTVQQLLEQFNIQYPYPREWWEEEKWVKKEQRQKEIDEEFENTKKEIYNDFMIENNREPDNMERLGLLSSIPLRQMLNYEGFAHKIFKVKKDE